MPGTPVWVGGSKSPCGVKGGWRLAHRVCAAGYLKVSTGSKTNTDTSATQQNAAPQITPDTALRTTVGKLRTVNNKRPPRHLPPSGTHLDIDGSLTLVLLLHSSPPWSLEQRSFYINAPCTGPTSDTIPDSGTPTPEQVSQIDPCTSLLK